MNFFTVGAMNYKRNMKPHRIIPIDNLNYTKTGKTFVLSMWPAFRKKSS